MWIANALQEIEIALIALAALAYLAVALASLAFTLAEGQLEGRNWDRWRMAGLALCLAWPVMILAFAAMHLAGRLLPATGSGRAGRRATADLLP